MAAAVVAAIAVATTTDINRISDTEVKDRREPVFLFCGYIVRTNQGKKFDNLLIKKGL
jgi:hypothetical protein